MLLYKQDKTPEDIEKLLEEHKGLVYAMLGRMGQQDNQNAESAAWEALWDAIATFDIYSNTSFSTYACKCIKNAIKTEMRKEYRHTVVIDDTDITTLCASQLLHEAQEDLYIVEQIYKVFNEYVEGKTGVMKNVLICWYSSSFTASVSNIAAMCNTSTSYVSRVQSGFRAYLAKRLKEL